MPMDFPDMKSLINCSKVWQFRQPEEGETEEHYREALADHVRPKDLVESQEIRHKVGWDRWNTFQNVDLLKRANK